ncbi:hypothetical protein BBJ28_00011678 [Nothophytophthora sp. Chile5]|nr:hypothetical protein BBJ28_00011678 [Nothophytophthora sp. Chile5]
MDESSDGASAPSSMELLANSAIAAGCLQAVMSLVHPELTKYVALQRECVARSDAGADRLNSRPRQPRRRSEAAGGSGALHPDQQTDISFHLKFLRHHWHSYLRFHGGNPELPVIVQRALMYRNKVSHQSQMTLQQYEHAIATFEKLAELIECNALIRQQIRELVSKLLSFSSLSQPSPAIAAPQRTETKEEAVKNVPKPPIATLEQLQQHNYFHDEDDEPLWLDLKAIGNEFFKEGNYPEAIEAYSQALDVAPHEAVLYGNRATCQLKLKEFDLAREDAEEAMDEDGGETVKYYRLLSEALMGLKEYDQAKEICDEGLDLDPKDEILSARRRSAEGLIERARAQAEKEEKKKREQEERARQQATTAAAATAAVATPGPIFKAGKHKRKTNKHKSKDKSSKATTEQLELAPMINYQEVSAKFIEVHARGSKRLEMHKQGMECMVVAARALVQVTDSIGDAGRSKLPLEHLVEEGLANLHKAGEAGVAEGWFRLGVLYSSTLRKGIPLTPDPTKKMAYFHKAAACQPFIKPPGNRVFPHQGVAEAENELGNCYRDGNPPSIVSVDLVKAFQFFLRSAEHDCPLGQYHVAIAYSKGEGTAADAFAARLWTSRAAQHGLPEAQQYLAQLFEKGFGGRRDANQAQQWAMTATQNRMADLMVAHDFVDVSCVAFGGGEVAKRFASNPKGAAHAKAEFEQFYSVYLDDEEGVEKAGATDRRVDDSDDIQITKVSSYTPDATSSSAWLGGSGIYRPASAVIDAEVASRANAGGPTAAKYLVSEELLASASSFLRSGNVKDGLRDLKRADLLWERPKGAYALSSAGANLLPMALRAAASSLERNPRDIDAAYAIGRWETMSDQDIVRHWKRCVKMHPREASFHFFLGTAYLTARRYDDATAAIEAALAIEKRPDWQYWLASPMVALGSIDGAMAIFDDYVSTNPPDERYVPDAYYSLGALYFKQYDNAMAVVLHELGQMAESVSIRFPAFFPTVSTTPPKDSLRQAMKIHGYMDPAVIADTVAQTSVTCGFCDCSIKPMQLLSHKLSKCPRRLVVCEVCGDREVFDAFQAHQKTHYPQSNAKNGSSKKPAASLAVRGSSDRAVTQAKKTKSEQEKDLKGFSGPKFHFEGVILEITKGKNTKPTVLTLRTVRSQRWTLRLNLSSQRSTAATGLLKALSDAAVDNTVLVFWRNSPPLEMIDRRALSVPMGGDVYGQDVVVHVLKATIQALNFELSQLHRNSHVAKNALCSSCGCPALPGGGLASCSACKMVKYCTRECQKLHWKRIHRFMCSDTALLANCSSLSEDITPNESVPVPVASGEEAGVLGPIRLPSHEETLEILRDIVRTVEASKEGEDDAMADANEHYMLPPYASGAAKPDAISGSVRIFRRPSNDGKGGKELVAHFGIGYLTAVPTPEQQQELHYFFQLPPHNPLQLRYHDTKVHLEKCQVSMDDGSGRGFRLGMELSLATFPLPALAELLDYLIANTNIYLT